MNMKLQLNKVHHLTAKQKEIRRQFIFGLHVGHHVIQSKLCVMKAFLFFKPETKASTRSPAKWQIILALIQEIPLFVSFSKTTSMQIYSFSIYSEQ